MLRALTHVLRAQRGVVTIEFLFAFMPIFVLFLGVLQLAFLEAAALVVSHAAVVGARAAMVVLPGAPSEYEGEVVGGIDEYAGTADVSKDDLKVLDPTLEADLPQGNLLDASLSTRPGARLSAIRRAVSWPLAAIAPEPALLLTLIPKGDQALNAADVLGRSPSSRLISALLNYERVVTAVTFPSSPGSFLLQQETVFTASPVTVRITHLYHCGVPLVSALMCDSVFTAAVKAVVAVVSNDKTAQKLMAQEAQELAHAPAAKLQATLLASGGHFHVLRAEATMPLQLAPYVGRKSASGP